jgi:serine acetyltransferase
VFRSKRLVTVFQDVKVNGGRPHIQVVLVLLRLAQAARGSGSRIEIILSRPMSAIYRLVALFAAGIDIPVSTKIGPGLAIHHGFGLVIHDQAVLGSNITLRQGVTIGAKAGSKNAPVVHDYVSFGSGCQVIGDVTIGEGSSIGAGAVVTKSVIAGSRMVGNPARPLPRPESPAVR